MRSICAKDRRLAFFFVQASARILNVRSFASCSPSITDRALAFASRAGSPPATTFARSRSAVSLAFENVRPGPNSPMRNHRGVPFRPAPRSRYLKTATLRPFGASRLGGNTRIPNPRMAPVPLSQTIKRPAAGFRAPTVALVSLRVAIAPSLIRATTGQPRCVRRQVEEGDKITL